MAELLGWLSDDVATAAPLMGAFTSHDTSIDHAVVLVPAAEQEVLARWLSERAGEPVEVVSASVIGGGFSRRMWRATLREAGVERRVIVRIEQGGMFGTDTITEVRTMRALHAAGFSVPAVESVEESGSVLGEPFFVMEEVPGVVRLDDQGLDDIIRSVADLHRVPVTVLDASGRTSEQVVSDNIEGWRRMYRAHSPEQPLIEQGADWLQEHLVPTGAVGDRARRRRTGQRAVRSGARPDDDRLGVRARRRCRRGLGLPRAHPGTADHGRRRLEGPADGRRGHRLRAGAVAHVAGVHAPARCVREPQRALGLRARTRAARRTSSRSVWPCTCGPCRSCRRSPAHDGRTVRALPCGGARGGPVRARRRRHRRPGASTGSQPSPECHAAPSTATGRTWRPWPARCSRS